MPGNRGVRQKYRSPAPPPTSTTPFRLPAVGSDGWDSCAFSDAPDLGDIGVQRGRPFQGGTGGAVPQTRG